MRRLSTLLLLLLVLALLAVAPVSAAPADSGVQLHIAVADYVPVNGDLDLVVFTGGSTELVEPSPICFLSFGQFEMRRMVIRDESSGQAGAVTGVVTSLPLKAGTRLTSMVHIRDCRINGAIYKVYSGVTE